MEAVVMMMMMTTMMADMMAAVATPPMGAPGPAEPLPAWDPPFNSTSSGKPAAEHPPHPQLAPGQHSDMMMVDPLSCSSYDSSGTRDRLRNNPRRSNKHCVDHQHYAHHPTAPLAALVITRLYQSCQVYQS